MYYKAQGLGSMHKIYDYLFYVIRFRPRRTLNLVASALPHISLQNEAFKDSFIFSY